MNVPAPFLSILPPPRINKEVHNGSLNLVITAAKSSVITLTKFISVLLLLFFSTRIPNRSKSAQDYFSPLAFNTNYVRSTYKSNILFEVGFSCVHRMYT